MESLCAQSNWRLLHPTISCRSRLRIAQSPDSVSAADRKKEEGFDHIPAVNRPGLRMKARGRERAAARIPRLRKLKNAGATLLGKRRNDREANSDSGALGSC